MIKRKTSSKIGETETNVVEPRTRCAIYARVSTEKQAENNISIRDQVARAKTFAEVNGWEVVETYREEGASAYHDNRRTEFKRMISEALSPHHPFDVILVYTFSRFYRDQAKSELTRRDLRKRRVEVRSLTQDIRDDGAGGSFALSVLALLDQHQSAENAKHVRRAIEMNARDGFKSGGVAIYGYRFETAEKRGQREKKKLGIEPHEVTIVADIFERYQKGLGVAAIASQLNKEGTRNRSGKKWTNGRVASILTNETYIGRNYFKGNDPITGEVRPRDEWILIPCPVIVSDEVFERVQEQLAARAPNVTAPRTTTSPVLLGGIARCGSCGGAMMLSTGKSRTGAVHRYYKCANRLKTGECPGHNAVIVPEAQFDELVVDAITNQIMTPDRVYSIAKKVLELTQREQSGADRVKMLKRQLSRARQDERRLWDFAASMGLKTSEGFKEKLADLEDQKGWLGPPHRHAGSPAVREHQALISRGG